MNLSLIGALAISSVSCHTIYDANGNPQQAVDPGLAVVGVAAAGLLAYSIGRESNDGHHQGYYPRQSYHHHHYRRPYCPY